MTKLKTALDTARHDAQALHQKISAAMASAEHATWAEVKSIQAEATALIKKMKALAADEAGDVKAGLLAAVTLLENAAKLVENKAVAVKDDVSHANSAMLDAVQRAAHSLSTAVASARTKVAHAIAPKKVVA